MASTNRLLYLSVLIASVAYFYSIYSKHKSKEDISVERTVLDTWKRIIEEPSVKFDRVLVGINSNVDLIVSGTKLLSKMKIGPAPPVDHEIMNSMDQFRETFALFFSRGAPGERYMSNEEVFRNLVHVAETDLKRHAEIAIGGNAALIANKIASNHAKTQVLLAGPIGPRLKSLLYPSIVTQNVTNISKDEIHLILEFKQGEKWGDQVAQSSSRFITSHDTFSSSAVVIEMFFNSILTYKPDLVVLSGLHLLEFLPKKKQEEKLKIIQKNLRQISDDIPIHLELGSMADLEYGKRVLHWIVPYVDSLGFNEQEISFVTEVGGGPFAGHFPIKAQSIQPYKATEIMNWLLTTFGPDKKNPDSKKAHYRLQRVHFHCLFYHMSATRGSDWSNGAAALAAAARLAGKQACDGQGLTPEDLDPNTVELRVGQEVLLDQEQEKTLKFNPHAAVSSWTRDDVLLIYTPVLVCKKPTKTVGLGDAISATGLMYSQFYRFPQK